MEGTILRRALECPPSLSGTAAANCSVIEPLPTAPSSQLGNEATVTKSQLSSVTNKQEVVQQGEEVSPRTLKQPRGKHLHPSALKIVHNATEYFASKKKKFCLDYNVRDVAAECTGVSVATISRVRNMTRKSGGIITESMFKTRTPKSRRKKIISGFTDCDIRRRVYELYLAGELPTHKMILESAKADGMLDFSRELMRIRLQRMGFECIRFHNIRLTVEKPEIIASRLRYIKEMRRFRSEGRNIVFLLETKSCIGQSNVANKKTTSLVCTCAGIGSGLMKDSLSTFEGIGNSECEKVMAHQDFLQWLEEKLLRQLPPDSVIVMEPADHSTVATSPPPNMTTPKPSIIDWLQQNSPELKFSELKDLTKAELLEMVGNVKIDTTCFVVDKAILGKGHNPLRVPPLHYDLNPMRYFWAEVQDSLAKLKGPSSTTAMQKTVEAAFDGYAAAKWKTAWKKVEKYEKFYWNSDNAIDSAIDKLIAKYGGGSIMAVDDENDEEEEDSEGTSGDEDGDRSMDFC